MRRGIFVLGGLVLAALAACAELFDEPSQCKSDRDCTKFGGVCDITRAVCIPAPTITPDGGTGAVDGGGGGTDAAEDAPPPLPGCDVNPKNPVPIPNTAVDGGDAETDSVTLSCRNDWILQGRLFVKSGATITIEPNTRILALAGAALVLRPGAKIEAKGFRDQPIVFTASGATPTAGAWRGLIITGSAPPMGTYNTGTAGTFAYGGANAADNSGTLEFVRVEYASDGIVLAGVGSGTKIDHVQVRRPGNTHCFGIVGGRFDAKHLVCQYPVDEMFEISSNYEGRLQFLFGHKATAGGGKNGLLVDNAAPKIYNATVCGEANGNTSYGFLFRGNPRFDLNNAIITGWGGGIDAVSMNGINGPLFMRTSIVADNTTNPAFVEIEGGVNDTLDDDVGFDEVGFFEDGGTNKTTSAGLVACHDGANPQPWANAEITGGTAPPNDGFFDANATYIGAFKDQNDGWMKGAWVKLSDP